jgi:hypothetical protein
MNLLHIFIAILLIMGILLVVTAFYAYSKLTVNCTSSSLKNKLQWCIGLGSAFVSVGIGYVICLANKKCDIEHTKWKMYIILTTMIGLGIGMLVLTLGIQSDLKYGDCNVDLGTLPDILIAISSCLIALPTMYFGYLLVTSVKSLPKPKPIPIVSTPKSQQEIRDAAQHSQLKNKYDQLNKLNTQLEQQKSEKDKLSSQLANAISTGNDDQQAHTKADLALLDNKISNTISAINQITTEASSISNAAFPSPSAPSRLIPLSTGRTGVPPYTSLPTFASPF